MGFPNLFVAANSLKETPASGALCEACSIPGALISLSYLVVVAARAATPAKSSTLSATVGLLEPLFEEAAAATSLFGIAVNL